MTNSGPAKEVPQQNHKLVDIDRSRDVFQRLLVPLDTSTLSERVLELAADIAEIFRAEVVLLSVLSGSTRTHELIDPLDWEQERAASNKYLEEIAARFRARGIAVQVQTEFGSPAKEILRVARAREVGLIALATHGSGHATIWSLGSVASKVIEKAPCSVLLVPSDWESTRGRGLRVLVPIDGSQRAECAFAVATRIAAQDADELMLAHLIQEPQIATRTVPSNEERELISRLRELNTGRARSYLAETRERIAQDIKSVEVRTIVAPSPAVALLDLIAERETDLVVLAAQGRNFDSKYRFDGTASRMLANLRCPTMVIIGNDDRHRACRWSGSYVDTCNKDQASPTDPESV
jgi:nucleotide-binding universal stress UspA family protein